MRPAANNRARWILAGLIAAGVLVRLVLAFGFHGTNALDVMYFADASLRQGDWHAVYEAGAVAWPYPPPYLAWIYLASAFARGSGLDFFGVVQLLPILCDVGIALAVYVYGGWRGIGERSRLWAAGLVLLGPSFIAVSGYHGQLDTVAILPAVIALMLWERPPASSRAVTSGLLVGLGAAIKIVPGLMVVALAPSARSASQAAKLIAMAVAVPLVSLLPLYLAGIDLHRVTDYAGVPGLGGLSLVLNPDLGFNWMESGHAGDLNGIGHFVGSNSRWITAAGLIALAAFLLRYRPSATDAAVLLWLTVFVVSPNFFLSYMVWALPFFIMAGYLRETTILQAILVVPTILYYVGIGTGREAWFAWI